MRSLPFVLACALLVLLAVALFTTQPHHLPSALIGKDLPSFSLPRLESDKRLSQKDFATGTPSLLNIWASWCVPCRAEHKYLDQLAQSGVRVIGINYKDARTNARAFLARYGNPFAAIGVDDGKAGLVLGVYGVPETYLISGTGEIVARYTGALNASRTREIQTTISALGQARAEPPRRNRQVAR